MRQAGRPAIASVALLSRKVGRALPVISTAILKRRRNKERPAINETAPKGSCQVTQVSCTKAAAAFGGAGAAGRGRAALNWQISPTSISAWLF